MRWVINLVKNTQADHRIASVAFTSIAGLISLSGPPPAHLRNTHTKLDVLRQSTVACLLPAFNAELAEKGVKFDAVLPRDLADVVFTQRKWCGYRKRYISTGQYVHGVDRGTWIQLLITLDNMLLQFDPAFCAGCHVKWIHPRTNNQDLTECFFSDLWVLVEEGIKS